MFELYGKWKIDRKREIVPLERQSACLRAENHAFWVYCGFRRLKSRKRFVPYKGLAQNFPLLPQKSISHTNPVSCYSEPCGKIAHLM